MIKLGVCTSIQNAAILKKIGFDYIELAFAPVAQLPQADFDALRAQVEEAPLPVEAMNSMLPGERFPLCSDTLDRAALTDYLQTGFARAAALGVRVVVFGSGGARRRPDGMEEAVAYQKLADYLHLAAPLADAHGISIAIEPLRVQESNILNTVAEGRRLSALCDIPNVGVLADLYHMAAGNEPFDGMRAGALTHCHIAEAVQRHYPAEGDDSLPLYQGFFDALHAIGYQARVSIEGGCEDLPIAAQQSYALLNTLR